MDGQDKQDGFEYASAWRRLAVGVIHWAEALLIGLAVGLVVGMVAFAIGMLTYDEGDGGNLAGLGLFLAIPVMPIVATIVHMRFAFTVAKNNVTNAHEAVGVKVIGNDGEALTRWRAVARHLVGSPALSVSFPLFGLWIISVFVSLGADSSSGYYVWAEPAADFFGPFLWKAGLVAIPVLAIPNHIWMAIDRKGRGWHDRIFGTVVVRYQEPEDTSKDERQEPVDTQRW